MSDNWLAQRPPRAPYVAPKQPGIIGLVLGIVLMVLGPVIGTVVMDVSDYAATDTVSGVSARKADGGSYIVYLEGNTDMGIWVRPFGSAGVCQVLTISGARPYPIDTNITTSTMVQNYQLVARFTPPMSGFYDVRCKYGEEMATYKVALANSTAPFPGVPLGVLLIMGGFIGGLVALIKTLGRHSDWSTRFGSDR